MKSVSFNDAMSHIDASALPSSTQPTMLTSLNVSTVNASQGRLKLSFPH